MCHADGGRATVRCYVVCVTALSAVPRGVLASEARSLGGTKPELVAMSASPASGSDKIMWKPTWITGRARGLAYACALKHTCVVG